MNTCDMTEKQKGEIVKQEYERGYQSEVQEVCPHGQGDLMRRCAWIGGRTDADNSRKVAYRYK